VNVTAFRKGDTVNSFTIAGDNFEQWEKFGISADVFRHGESELFVPLIQSAKLGSGNLDIFLAAMKTRAFAEKRKLVFVNVINPGLAKHLALAGIEEREVMP